MALSRAERLIRDADVEAEQLIGFVRIVVAAILGMTLFFASQGPRADESVAAFRLLLAGSTIGIWIVLGVATILIVRSHLYRPWMAWLFGLFDVSVICGNLFLTATLGGTGAMLVLASPASILICVLFVLQALRYRVGLQFFLSASLLLILTVLVFLPGSAVPDEILQRVVQSEFSLVPNSVRLVLLGIVAGITTFAVWRAYRLLNRVARETEMRVNQTRFLPSELSTSMTDADIVQMRHGRSVELVIMFVDVRGFTAMFEAQAPEEISQFLGEYRAHVTDAVTAQGGIVDKFIGDGALIVFGLETSPQQAARSAVAAGHALLKAIETWNDRRQREDKPSVRIAIAAHAGRVVAGAIGDERRLEFSIVGSPVNEASRIEALAKQRDLTFVVSDAIIHHLKTDHGQWKTIGREILRGKKEPIHLFAHASNEPALPASSTANSA